MAVFVLVHGAYHGAWCWERLTPLLEAAGHRVIAPDLPGHGADPAPLAEVSLAAYAERVAETAGAAGEAVVAVGHSMAGAVVSAAAERAPDAFRRLVYLTAYLPGDGETVSDWVRADTQFRIPVERSTRGGVACLTLDAAALRRHFYHDADDADFDWAAERVGAQAARPFTEALGLSAGAHGRVPRAYIRCRGDRAIGFALQRRMAAAMPCDPVRTLNGGHSPFLTRPAELADVLAGLA